MSDWCVENLLHNLNKKKELKRKHEKIVVYMILSQANNIVYFELCFWNQEQMIKLTTARLYAIHGYQYIILQQSFPKCFDVLRVLRKYNTSNSVTRLVINERCKQEQMKPI